MNCTSQYRDSRCSGNGYLCQPANFCVCDSGWSALGDYSIVEGANCDIHNDTIVTLALIEAFGNSVYIVMILRHFYKRIVATTVFRHFLVDPKTWCAVFFLLAGFSGLSLALPVAVPKNRQIIGRDVTVSVAATCFTFFALSALSFYFQIIINYLKKSLFLLGTESRRNVIVRLLLLQNFSWLLVPLSIPSALGSILAVIYPEHVIEFAKLFLLGVAVLVCSYGFAFVACLAALLSELSAHILSPAISDTDSLHTVYRRIWMALYGGGSLLIGGSFGFFLFGSSNFLLQKLSYLMVITRLIGVCLFIILYVTFSGTTTSSGTVVPQMKSTSSTNSTKKLLKTKPIYVLSALDMNVRLSRTLSRRTSTS